MSKNLRQLREKASAKGGKVKLEPLQPPKDNTVATQHFYKKHVAVHHPDPAGNGDDVYKASNITPVKRSPEHGYDPGQDEEVYEGYIVESKTILDRAQNAAHDYSGEVVLTNPEKTKQWALADHDKSGSYWYPHHHDPKIDDMSPDPDRSYNRFSHEQLGKMLDSGHTLHILHHEEPKEDREGGITIDSKSLETGAMLRLNANGNVSKEPPQAVKRHPGSLIYVPTRKRTNESYVTEVLDIKNMTVKQVIDDFVKSKDKRFAGKSRKERIKMALGAYYAAHPRERTTKEETETFIDEMKLVTKSGGPAVPMGQVSDLSALDTKMARAAANERDLERMKKLRHFHGYWGHGSSPVFQKPVLQKNDFQQALTNLYNTLNEENREVMLKLMESEEGVVSLVEFAIEKGID